MGSGKKESKKRGLADLLKFLAGVIAVIAVVQELRKPSAERTWNGTVAGFVPYDFRKPTLERAKETYWNPDGPLVSSRVFGVGWSPNFGAIWNAVNRSTG